MVFDYKKKFFLVFSISLIGIIFNFFLIEIISYMGLLSSVFLVIILFGFFIFDNIFDIRYKMLDYFLIIIVGVFGFYLGFLHFYIINYDKIQHFYAPMVLVYLLCVFFDKKLEKSKDKNTKVMVLSSFISLCIILLYEVFELIMDVYFNTGMQGNMVRNAFGNIVYTLSADNDTKYDLIIGFLSILMYDFFCLYKEKKIRKS